MHDFDGLDPTKLVMLVVAEAQSPCDVPFARLRGLNFLRQDPGERLLSLAARLTRLVDGVRREGLVVAHAWMLLNPRREDGVAAVRTSIARMLGQVVERSGGRGLTLVARGDTPHIDCAAVLSLAEAVLEAQTPSRVTVHVRFVPTARPARERRVGARK
jgi:hypothetical protein